MRHAPAHARGFTLFEMLAVILLIGVIASLLAVGLGRGLQSMAERKALAQMVDGLRAARVRAIVSGQPAQARFDLQHRTLHSPGKPLASWPVQWQVQVQTAEQLGAAFEFYPDGGASGGNVLVSREGRHWRIDVAWLTGAVRLRELP